MDSKANLARSPLAVAALERGCCVRVNGSGTMRESEVALELATRTLESQDGSLVVYDLTACDYLDSTFLGSLVTLFRGYGKAQPPRFQIAASPERRRKLLASCHLDRLLPPIDATPPLKGDWVPVDADAVASPQSIARHVMECHRALAEVDGPMKAVFTRIADQLERELAGAAAASSPPR